MIDRTHALSITRQAGHTGVKEHDEENCDSAQAFDVGPELGAWGGHGALRYRLTGVSAKANSHTIVYSHAESWTVDHGKKTGPSLRSRTTGQVVLLLTAFMLFAPDVQAQVPVARDSAVDVTPRYRFRILGVYDERTGDPLEGVDVIDVLSGNMVKTTSTGTASLRFLPDGGGLVRLRKIGYQLTTMMVGISPDDTNPVTTVLSRVQELPTVAVVDSAPRYVSPSLRRYEERRKNGGSGYFIPESLLRKEDGRPLGNTLVAHLNSVNIKQGPAGKMVLMQSTRCGKGGPPDVYLDGVRLAHPSYNPFTLKPSIPEQTPIDLSEFSVSNLAGVEYYPVSSTAPAEFGSTSSACGVLLLWSRER